MLAAANWTYRLVVVSACALLGLSALCACEPGPQQSKETASTSAPAPAPGPKTLTILTPYDESIRQTFAAGFTSWYQANRGEPVQITWITRGAPQGVRHIVGLADPKTADGAAGKPDVFFGGGIGAHSYLAEQGLLAKVDPGDVLTGIPAEVHEVPTRDPEGRWFATGLVTYGIVYNAAACEERQLTPPQTWRDLGHQRFKEAIAMADPMVSEIDRDGIVRMFQQFGYVSGWRGTVMALANSPRLYANRDEALALVETGKALAAIAADYEGRALEAKTAGAVKYADMPQGTSITTAVTSVLAAAADRELATDFLRYVLSTEGQSLWCVPLELREPHGVTLYHHAIAPRIYEQHGDQLTVKQNPFETKYALKPDLENDPLMGAFWGAYAHAVTGENHAKLHELWHLIVERGMPNMPNMIVASPKISPQQAVEFGRKVRSATAEELDVMIKQWIADFDALIDEARGTMQP
jgi:ABC-type Fe3+ transport system substrate-binding protein